jgi:hypothetical protein
MFSIGVDMLKLLKLLFKSSDKKKKTGNKTESCAVKTDNETIETKKCLFCLRRIKLDYWKCPYCSSLDFQF